MSNIILEAMSSGVPVIATKSIGMSELIVDGINGFLIEEDITNLSNKIVQLAKNPSLLKKMGSNGRHFVCEKYSIDNMISSYQNIYLTNSNL